MIEITSRYRGSNLLEFEGLVFPIIVDVQKYVGEALPICIKMNNKGYTLPRDIECTKNDILAEHGDSVIYDNPTVRLRNLEYDGVKVKLECELTTYLNTLCTNRSMNYTIRDDKTIRDLYEPGPKLSSLVESKLSNHIGFSGLVKTTDDKIIFVKRSNKVSTAKGKWSPSISASLKAAYSLDSRDALTLRGLSSGIAHELYDELKIVIQDDNLCNMITCFYRDVIEGGKPHFAFYVDDIGLSYEEFITNFEKVNSTEDSNHELQGTLVDGVEFLGFTLDELANASYKQDSICVSGQVLNMSSTGICTVIAVLKYLRLV